MITKLVNGSFPGKEGPQVFFRFCPENEAEAAALNLVTLTVQEGGTLKLLAVEPDSTGAAGPTFLVEPPAQPAQ